MGQLHAYEIAAEAKELLTFTNKIRLTSGESFTVAMVGL